MNNRYMIHYVHTIKYSSGSQSVTKEKKDYVFFKETEKENVVDYCARLGIPLNNFCVINICKL